MAVLSLTVSHTFWSLLWFAVIFVFLLLLFQLLLVKFASDHSVHRSFVEVDILSHLENHFIVLLSGLVLLVLGLLLNEQLFVLLSAEQVIHLVLDLLPQLLSSANHLFAIL